MVTRRSTAAPYIAIAVLIALLLAAGAFVVAMVLRPTVTSPSALVVTDRVAIPCTPPKHNTTCFDSAITNQGSAISGFSCRITAFGDTTATFVDGAPTYELTLASEQVVHVATVVTTQGDVEAVAPRVSCLPVQT